ncbi:MAG: hypothetical protein KBB21_05900 [Nannocystaceae bacterium]|nr:hypothetical protein [Nannocystaceae bacterium]
MMDIVRGVVLLATIVGAAAGCKSKASRGELTPPKDAAPWEEQRYGVSFDDDYTAADLELQGRAPHDVLDQRLFGARLGHADLILQVHVDQVWGRGRYQGRKAQYLDVELGEVLFGELPKGTRASQLVVVDGEDELPGALQGADLVLFLRWAPGDKPPYHHHLMPASEAIVSYIRALVKHARDEGALDGRKGKRRGRRGKAAVDTGDGAPE